MLRRLLLVVVCFLPLTLAQASANSSAPGQPGQIVYASTRGPNVNNAEIYSIGVDGSQRRDLTRDQGNDGSFAWSPTGDRVAFWAARAGVRAQGLFVMRADGSAQQRLTPPDLSVSPYGDPPTWSPDGRRIAFSAYRDGYGIWVVGADGSGLTRLTDAGHFPVWAPQGSRIAFVSGETDYDYALEVVDADGGGRLRLAEGNVLSPPTWSPDAGALAYVWRDRY